MAALLSLLLLSPAIGTAQAGTIQYKDKLGRTVRIQVPVRRAVLFETYELTAALGVWDRVAGISRYAYENDLIRAVKPDLARTVPSPGSGIDLNAETLFRLRPDCLITWSFKPETVHFLEEKGLPVVAVYPESLPELYEVMRLQGRMFGKEKKVEQVIGRMDGVFSLIRRRLAQNPPQRRRAVLWLGSKPTVVSGGVGLNNGLIGLVGAVNPAASIRDRSTDVSMERIVAWNPEVAFIWGSSKYTAADVLKNPQWRHTAAARNRMVHKAPKWSAWSPRIALVALWMAMKTYPESFRGVNFDRVADEFCLSVYNIPYRRLSPVES